MRKYNIKQDYKVPENIDTILENNFGKISEKSLSKYVIKNPEYEIIEKIELKVNTTEKELYLHFEEKDISDIKSNSLLSTVPKVFNCKNKLLRELTGTTVDERKEKMKQEVLSHTNSELINT